MSKKRVLQIGSIVAVLAVAGAVAWLFISGMLVWNGTKQTVTASTTIVCDSDIVTRYNTAMTMIARGESQEYSIDQAGLDALVKEIQEKDGYADDPTCQTILFWAAVNNLEYEKAKAANEVIQALHEKNLYADSDIKGNGPVSTYDDVVYSISPEASQKPAIPLGG